MPTFPLQDHPIILPSGRVVRIFNLLSLTQSDDPTSFLQVEPSLRIQYATYISPDQPVERSAEAAEVIAYFLSEAASERSTVAHAEICSTPAQAETPAPAKKPRKICKQDDQASGSRMARRLCLTEEEWSQRARGMTNSNRSGFSGKSEDH